MNCSKLQFWSGFHFRWSEEEYRGIKEVFVNVFSVFWTCCADIICADQYFCRLPCLCILCSQLGRCWVPFCSPITTHTLRSLVLINIRVTCSPTIPFSTFQTRLNGKFYVLSIQYANIFINSIGFMLFFFRREEMETLSIPSMIPGVGSGGGGGVGGGLGLDDPDLSVFENKSGLAEDLKFLASMPELCDVKLL